MAILSGREVFEQMQMPAQGRRFARHRRLSLAGWGLAVVGAFVAMPATSFAIASAVLDREADLVAGAFIGVGGLVLAAGLGMGLGGTDVLDKIDIYGAIMNHNRQRQLELGLIGSLPSLDLPARTTAAQRRKARGNPPPWRWPAIGGMTGGAILTITGGVLVGLHKTCPDGSDPRMYFNACPQVYDTAAAGGVLLGVGLSATVGMTALLTVGEIRHRRRATFEQRRARFEKLTGFRMAPVVQGVVLSL